VSALFVAVASLMIAEVAQARIPNACTLLTRAQATAALGSKLRWSQPQGDKLSSICTFHGQPYSASSYGEPTLTLMVYKSNPAKFRRGFNTSMSGVRVRGIGEMAYTTSGAASMLNVLSKGYALTVTIPEGKNLRWAKALAGQALAHL
jgi:hypothetical protein